jgi:hypothetical protein
MAKKQTTVTKPAMVGIVIAIIIAIVIIHLATEPAAPSATWNVQVTAFKVLPQNYVRVFFSVENTSTVAGNPDCSVIIQPTTSFGDDTSGDGLGTLSMVNNVAAGATVHTYIDIVVSANDAHFVTSKSMIQVSDC